MESEFVTSEVFVEIHKNNPVPIIISAEGAFVNLTLDELEKVYQYAKNKLDTH